MPPSSRGFSVHARWLNFESTDAPSTSALSFLNSPSRSENARISVGQTNVKSSGIEEKDDPFSLVVGEAIGVELAVQDAFEGEFGGHSADDLGHGNSPCAGLMFPGAGILAPYRDLV